MGNTWRDPKTGKPFKFCDGCEGGNRPDHPEWTIRPAPAWEKGYREFCPSCSREARNLTVPQWLDAEALNPL